MGFREEGQSSGNDSLQTGHCLNTPGPASTCPDLQLYVALGKLGDGTMMSMVNMLSLGRVGIPDKQESHRVGAQCCDPSGRSMACLAWCPSGWDRAGLPGCHREGNTGQVVWDGDIKALAAGRGHHLY